MFIMDEITNLIKTITYFIMYHVIYMYSNVSVLVLIHLTDVFSFIGFYCQADFYLQLLVNVFPN